MKFYEHRLLRTGHEARQRAWGDPLPPGSFYHAAFARCAIEGSDRGFAQLKLEQKWEAAKKPYYLVYPGILDALLRINLDLETALIRPPIEVLSIRLPENQTKLAFDWEGETIPIREIMVAEIRTNLDGEAMAPGTFTGIQAYDSPMPPGICRGLSVWVDFGEAADRWIPIQSYRNIRLHPGVQAEAEISQILLDPSALDGIIIPVECWRNIFRLVFTLYLLEDDPDIIAPDVLAKDAEKFEKTGDRKYIDKALRRGKKGWRIGHKLEVMPHYRRPHLFLAPCGKGRTERKLVMRKGSIVHRDKVKKLPTGYSK